MVGSGSEDYSRNRLVSNLVEVSTVIPSFRLVTPYNTQYKPKAGRTLISTSANMRQKQSPSADLSQGDEGGEGELSTTTAPPSMKG